MSGWQPIKTAPSGINLLVGGENHYCRDDTVCVAKLSDDWWIVAGGVGERLRFNPTHWQPLPEPPKAAK